MIAFVEGGLDLSLLITYRISIDDFEAGFEVMHPGNTGKVVMD